MGKKWEKNGKSYFSSLFSNKQIIVEPCDILTTTQPRAFSFAILVLSSAMFLPSINFCFIFPLPSNFKICT